MRRTQKEDLHVEPSLREALDDPVVQALMRRDRVSREDVIQLALEARLRLQGISGALATRDAVGGFSMRSAVLEPANDVGGLRPRTRWPFCLKPSC